MTEKQASEVKQFHHTNSFKLTVSLYNLTILHSTVSLGFVCQKSAVVCHQSFVCQYSAMLHNINLGILISIALI